VSLSGNRESSRCEVWRSSGKDDGWQFLASCKTHYASLHGWEAFRRGHVAAVDLALAGQSLGIQVRIEDEGGYWPGRNEIALRAVKKSARFKESD
jgi:hypothetical protein